MSNVRTLADGYGQLHRMANDPTPRVPLGIPYLDNRLNGGLAKGQCCMVMAFSHVGKTSLALNAIYQNTKIPILFYSIEMAWDQVASKLTAMATQRSTSQIEQDFRGNVVPDYVQSMVDRHNLLLCDDSPDLSIKAAEQSFQEASEAFAARGFGPPRLVILDYLELVSGNGMMEKSTQVDRAAERVHMFARKFKTSVMLLHQVGKGEAGGGAEPLDLGSGRYGGHQTMDVVVGMWNPSAKKDLSPSDRKPIENQRVLGLLKNRVTGQVDLSGLAHRLDPVSMRLSEWSSHPQLPWQPAHTEELEFA